MKNVMSYFVVFVIGFFASMVMLGALHGNTLAALLPDSDRASQQAVLTNLNAAPPAAHTGHSSVIADAVAKVEPSVVDVHTEGKAVTVPSNPLLSDPFFKQFFGAPGSHSGPQKYVPKGAGSGIIISPDGYIITNNHVVTDTQKVTVSVGDTSYDAHVVGTDSVSDIAVVKIDTKGVRLPIAQFGNSDDLRVGDWAIAVGNPLDIGTTVTLGIISAVNRRDLSAEGHPMGAVIQTDAAINPGNSGGALANIDGQVIGINEAIYSPTGTYVGIGFAVPINEAKKIASELVKNGRVIRPYLGISYAPLKIFSPSDRAHLGIPLKTDEGIVIQNVAPGTPAESAGLRPNDVILEAGGQPIADTHTLDTVMSHLQVGSPLALLVSRNGKNRTITARLAERPANYGEVTPQPETPDDGTQAPDP